MLGHSAASGRLSLVSFIPGYSRRPKSSIFNDILFLVLVYVWVRKLFPTPVRSIAPKATIVRHDQILDVLVKERCAGWSGSSLMENG